MKQSFCEELATMDSLMEAVRASDDWVFVHDYKRILWISSSLADQLGYSQLEMEGTLLIKFIAASGYVGLIQAISKNRLALLKGDADAFNPMPTKVKHKNGGTLSLQAKCSADVKLAEVLGDGKARLTLVELAEES